MTIAVSDKFSNVNDNLAHAATTIGKSKHRRIVFDAICRGKKLLKTQDEIRKATGLRPIRILQETGTLFAAGLIHRQKIDGHLAYRKDPFYCRHKQKIIGSAIDKQKLARLPTKVSRN